MEDSGSEEELSDMKRPSLVNDLRAILEEYPDNGQIFKELIQNAEDAGASTVRIIYDPFDAKCKTKSCPHCQGPAIYVCNNARFTKEDWEGIKMLRKSVKEVDPLKVGRYGLGFKSVFHITDFPCVVSGNSLLLFDPSKPEDRVCATYLFSNLKSKTVQCMRQVFGRVLDMSSSDRDTAGGFDGTVFRFPLRQTPSELSPVVYDDKRVADLLKCFKTEMMLVLVFLKSLESVEIWTPQKNKSVPELSFSVCLSDESAGQRRYQKGILKQTLAAETTSSWTSSVHCMVKDHTFGLEFPLNWTVKSLSLGKNEMSASMRALSEDPILSYPPFVGVSVVDVPLQTCETIRVMKLMETALHGHVYCFLPLPLQKNSLTGLPVHVNGYFALSSNRHHLKWPTADEEHQGTQRDKSCGWNHALLTEAVPKVYSLLIEELVETSKRQGNPQESVQAVYKAFPSVETASSMWLSVVQGFYRCILSRPCFFSDQDGGIWVTVSETVFCQGKSSVSSEVLGILKHLGITVSCVPENVFHTVPRFLRNEMKQVTPSYVRKELKENIAYEQESHFKKLQLLNFIMEDLVENKDFHELHGIKLLPLSDGTFTAFREQRYETRFSATETFHRSLFPGLEDRFLTEDSIHKFPDGLHRKLKILLQSGKTQMRPVMKGDIPMLLGQVSEFISRQPRQDIEPWITNVWKMLCSEFPSSLYKFQGLRLLPLSAPYGLILEELQCPSLKVLNNKGQTALASEVKSVVEKLGVQVLTEVAPEVLMHPGVMGEFILEPTASSVLQALTTARDSNVSVMDLSLTRKQRSVFVAFIASCDRPFTHAELKLLVSIRLFQAVGPHGNVTHVSVQELKTSAPDELIPISFPSKLIVYESLAEKSLGERLGIHQLRRGDLILNVLEKMLQEPDMYSRSQLLHFMEYILSNRSGLNAVIWDLVRKISFVPCTDNEGKLRKPSELFDPTLPKLRDLFVGEDVFPGTEFELHTPILRSLGLKTEPTEQDLLSCALKLESIQTNIAPDLLNRKSCALIFAIADRPKLSPGIVQKLKTVAFLPIKTYTPSHFPHKMPWFSSDKVLEQPSQAMDKSYQDLIGSVMPVTVLPPDLSKSQKSHLEQMLELNHPPPLPKLLEQLKIAIGNFDPDNMDFFVTVVKKLYRQLQKFSHDAILSEMKKLEINPEWIWNGKEFSSSEKIYVEQTSEDLNLVPYMVCLPEDMRDLKPFFLSFGCHRKQDQEMMLQVLHMIKTKYSKLKTRQKVEIQCDFQSVLTILHHFSALREEGNLTDAARILVPVEVGGTDGCFGLKPANECVYYDSSEWVSMEDISADERDIYFVHRNVSRELACSLGVSLLMDKLLDAQELDMNFGQSEPLTRRLRNLIQHYTDGVAVIKELIQNADDAGATQVCFLYDERQNTNCRSKLINKNMAECQGAALWTYNNAMFTDEDFQNITKISGATKLDNAAKIGKFGLGFNAVYNLTDVPSFVSRDVFVIFDPHKTFLGKPGLKMNIRKNRKMVNRLRDQFQPYNGIFGCDFQSRALNFQGTLFRFPLRTSKQADQSQISNLHYTHQEVVRLLEMSLECAGNLLMFTRNVTNMKFFHLSSRATDASKQTLLFKVSKSKTGPIIMVNMTTNNKECDKLNLKLKPGGKRNVKWLMASSNGGQKISHFLTEHSDMKALHPEGSVAIPVTTTEDQSYEAIPFEKCPAGFLKYGLVYCYLPLPILTKLPALINGSFSVTSDRRRLSKKTVDEKKNRGSEWNDVLLEDSLAKSYVGALQELGSKAHHKMFELWPTQTNCDTYLTPLLHGFYGCVSSDLPEILPGRDKFTSLQNAAFLDSKLRFDSGKTGEVAFEVFHQLLKETEKVAIDLPKDVRVCFSLFRSRGCVDEKTFTIHDFYEKLFLPRIDEIDPEQRDVLIFYALKSGDSAVLNALKETPCIPVDQSGKVLGKPVDLIHPKGEIACLYDDAENRFPARSKNMFCNHQILDVLVKLGMLKNTLPVTEVQGRAYSIEHLSKYQPDKALSRFRGLIRVLVKMNKSDLLNFTADDKDKLNTIDFLPVLQRPAYWPSSLQWKADGGPEFECPRNMYHEKKKNLVGSQRLVMNCAQLGYDSETVLKRLGISVEPSANDLVLHLRALSKIQTSQLSNDELNSLEQVYEDMYFYLEKCYKKAEGNPKWVEELAELNSLFINKEHVSPQTVAVNFNYECSPFLFRLSERYSRLYPNIMNLLGVKKAFSRFDHVNSLQTFYEKYRETTLDLNTIRLLIRMLTALVECAKSEHGNPSKEDLDEIMLPDQNGKLCLSEKLCFDDCSWINESGGVMRYVHNSVSREMAELLGVKSKQHWCLVENTEGIQIPFGQREELTNRLKGILQGYPCDSTILKELLQNADDAGATEIQFIKDWRSHESEKVFSEEWKELQGPALCVYNNAAFTDKDLEGIQSLGKGSKRDDPLKTGKYGIGFNVVYHLTDVPSFLVKSEKKETLCAFDPNRKYIPNMHPFHSGMKWPNLPVERRRFPDTFACYPDSILQENTVGTLFRFPLRNVHMAEKSEIKSKPISVDDLDILIEDFKKEGKEALLFTKNVRAIKIVNVAKDGAFVTMYEIKANLDIDSFVQKKQILLQRRRLVSELQLGMSVENVTNAEIKYFVEIQELQSSERWFVKQKIGFENPEAVPDSLKEAISTNSLNHLPIGGVAFPLTPTRYRNCKAFCGLPLPVLTGMPVHIDADFALDYEQRRHLYYSPTRGVRTKWNEVISEQLLAPLYASGIVDLTDILFDSNFSVQNSLKQYHDLFPLKQNMTDSYWEKLCLAVYKHLDSTSSRVLPVIQETPSGKVVKKWLPPTGQHELAAFFNTLTNQDIKTVSSLYGYGITGVDMQAPPKSFGMTNLLLTLGFNLVSTPLNIYRNFREAKIDVKEVLPDAVVEFLRTYSDSCPLCNIGELPCPIGQTSFKTTDNFRDLLSYCKDCDKLKESLEGLPLLLTCDETLRLFRKAEKVFVSQHSHIVPHSADRFLHQSVRITLGLWKEKLPQVKPFRIKDFNDLLCRELPERAFGSNQPVCWDGDRAPDKLWLKSVWNYLTDEIMLSAQKATREEMLRSMEDILMWSLLPATRTQNGKEHLYLVPISFADQVFAESPWLISTNLQKAGFYIFQRTDEEKRWQLMAPELPNELIVPVSNVEGILTGVTKTLCSAGRTGVIYHFKPEVCEGILQYFSDQLEQVKKIPNHKSLLRHIPFFVTVYDEGVKIDGLKAIVLPEIVPSYGMEEWSQKESLVLLKKNEALDKLYNHLGLSACSEIDFYYLHIFKAFHLLDNTARRVHLEFVRDHLIPKALLVGKSTLSKFQTALQKLSFIPRNHILERASVFYDHKHSLFKAMLKRNEFVPEPFREEQWDEMLSMAGLTKKVSDEMFVELAKQLEEDGPSQREKKTVFEKSQRLIRNLFTEQKDNSSLLERVRNIKFLIPESASTELQVFASCYRSSPSMICFYGSTLPEHQELVWSSCDVLRQYCVPGDKEKKEQILKTLCVRIEPTPESVVQNLQNIIQGMNTDKQLQKLQHQNVEKLCEICCHIYTFLQRKELSEDVRDILRELSYVVIKEHRCFAKPKQVVVELKSMEEIAPYLFTLPKELGPFCELFLSVGVSNDVSAKHYENVLVQIRESCQENDLEPNEMKAALKAVKGMYKELSKSEGQVQIDKLYLPGKRGDACVIQLSTDIVISDKTYLEKRVAGDRNFVFLANLDEENVGKMELWSKLPDSHKPQLLSKLVEERLTDACRPECQQTEKCLKLQTAVSSSEVLHGTIRLIKHYRIEEGKHDCTLEIEHVQNYLSSVRIFCCSEISTYLKYQDSIISDSVDFTHQQHCEEVKRNSTLEMHFIFVEKVLDDRNECFTQICKSLCTYHIKLPEQALLLIQRIFELSYRGRSIHDYLNQQGIIEFQMNEAHQEKPDLPSPGSYIPVNLHCLLDPSFTFFGPGQYVGFEVCDPMLSGEDGDPVYVYAIVQEVIKTDGISNWQTLYKVDMGEIITVSATDLYAFHRKQPSATGEIEVFSGQTNPTDAPDTTESKSLKEVKEEIFKGLKEAWQMDQITGRKVLKRLLLKWHPDKNPERIEFCTKITQYIFALVTRFEIGDFSTFEDESDIKDTGTARSWEGFYGSFFTKANRRGTQYGRNFGTFSSRDTTDGGHFDEYYSSYDFTRSSTNPQPTEGRRWIRQAQADFDAIRNDQEGPKPSCVWVCFKCQQVAEKAMKAVLYKINANHYAIRSHELLEIADALDDSTLSTLAQELVRTLGYKGYMRTRYPDMLHGQQIPSDVYSWRQAETSKDLCGKILDQAESILYN